MPYIKPESRPFYDEGIEALVECMSDACEVIDPDEPGYLDAGALTYIFTRIAEGFREICGDSYHTFHTIRGCLADAQAEFYRRVQAPYEDLKRAENGDVYVPVAEPPF